MSHESPTTLSVATLNVHGLSGRVEDVMKLVIAHNIDLLFLCETWSGVGTRSPHETIIGFTPYPDKKYGNTRKSCGTAFAVHPRWLGQLSDFVVDTTPHPGLTTRVRFQGVVVCGIYIPPLEPLEKCHMLLHGVLPQNNEQPLILVGDFNMRLGAITGDTYTNPRGTHLAPWLEEQDLVLLKSDRGVPTSIQWTHAWSIVDYIWASPLISHRVLHVRTISEDDVGGTDHRAILARFHMNVSVCEERLKKRFLKTERLCEPGIKERFSVTLTEELSKYTLDLLNFSSGQAWVNALDERILTCVKTAALEVLGEKSPRFTRASLCTPELRAARKNRKRAFAAWHNTFDPELRVFRYTEYQKARAQQHREVRKSQHAVFTRFAKDMSLKPKSEQVRVLASMAKSRKQMGGCALKSDEEGLHNVETHFIRMFNSSTLPDRETMACLRDDVAHGESGPPPFSMDAVLETLRCLPGGKAPGRSGLKGELFSSAASALAGPVFELFKAVWEWGVCPHSWKTARIHPLHKKGARDDVANYRPISLTENLRKAFERVLYPSLVEVAEPLDIRQGGFRRMRGTLEQVACLHDAVRHRATATKGQVQLAFLDIKAAYDSVHRPLLWEQLHKRGASQNFIDVLQALFDHNVSHVAVNDRETGEVAHISGLLQGSILSPTLYSIFIDDLPKRLALLGRPGQAQVPVAAYLYADDIALVADNVEHLQNMLNVCEAHAKEHGYRFAPAKCIHVGAKPGETVHLQHEPLPKSDVFPYLGVPFSIKGIDYGAHAEQNAETFTKSLHLFRAFGLHGNGLPLETSRHAYVTFLRPILEYGLPLLCNVKARARLQACQNMALRFMLSAPRGTSTALMHDLFNIPLVDTRFEVLRAKWLTRVHCAPPSCLVYHALVEYKKKAVGASTLHHKAKTKLPRVSRHADDFDKQLGEFIKAQHEGMMSLPTTPKRISPPDLKSGGLLRILDGYEDRRATKVVAKWVTRRFGGEPLLCTKCKKHRATPAHMQQCTHLCVDKFIECQEWSRAAEALRLVASLCTTWQCCWSSEWTAPPSLCKKKRRQRPP